MWNTEIWMPKPFEAEEASNRSVEDGLRIVFLDVDGVLNLNYSRGLKK